SLGPIRHPERRPARTRACRAQSAAVHQRQAGRECDCGSGQARQYCGERIDMNDRRDFLKATGAALTTSIFTGNVRGANDRIRVAFIGMGRMGTESMENALQLANVEVPVLCDVYQPNLEKAVAISGRGRDGTPDARSRAKGITDFRDVLHDKSIEIVTSGKLGKVTFVRTWNYGHQLKEGIGNPPDAQPPAGLDWNMWLGPAPERPFNKNRFGVDPKAFSHFRWFWDYAGGMMTDWGIHLLDIVQMAFQETEPTAVAGFGGTFYLQDNRETPDTLQGKYEYPTGMIAPY